MRKRIPLKERLSINDIALNRTVIACPEIYEAFVKEKQIGYLRLRHGHFIVRYPNASGTLVWESFPEGDGIFTDSERPLYLKIAKEKLLEYHKIQHKNGPETKP